uniref:Uncharacterized protein n=1 Tax=Nelumbo nucifera TaxID=4432 RepID=A0A822YB68_NELNU|nr:TPA_asm: hypothetical protein HUJ06_029774 [Nelumbo nucifera]
MEGLIPYVYRAIVQYRTGGQASIAGTWFDESPSASYMRLPGDSGRFQASEIQLLRPDRVTTSSMAPSTSQLIASTTAQSPLSRSASRRLVA